VCHLKWYLHYVYITFKNCDYPSSFSHMKWLLRHVTFMPVSDVFPNPLRPILTVPFIPSHIFSLKPMSPLTEHHDLCNTTSNWRSGEREAYPSLIDLTSGKGKTRNIYTMPPSHAKGNKKVTEKVLEKEQLTLARGGPCSSTTCNATWGTQQSFAPLFWFIISLSTYIPKHILYGVMPYSWFALNPLVIFVLFHIDMIYV
jgi:hypothetical protein